MDFDEPASSAPFPAHAVEVVAAPQPAGFAHGIAIGIAIASVLAAVWLAMDLGPLRDVYGSWAPYVPPSLRIVSPWWLWGVPAAGALATAGVLLRRPHRLWPYVTVAVVTAASVIATYYLATYSLHALASNIVE